MALLLVAFVALTGALTWVEGVLLRRLGADALGWWIAAGRGLWHRLGPSLVAIASIYGWMLARGSWRAGAVGLARPWGPALARGAAWGVGLAVTVVGLVVAGGARIVGEPATGGSGYPGTALTVLVGLAVAALVEELLFRGWPLARLARAGGPLAAAIAVSVAFAALHAPNDDVTVLGLVNIGLAGFVLAAVFFAGGGLPAAWALHLGWNAGLALAADAPVSGMRFALPGIGFVPGRAVWWDGGPFGPEGGLAATVVLGGAAWYWLRRLARESAAREGVTA